MLGIAIVEDDGEHAALLESFIRQYAEERHIPVSVQLFHDAVTFLDQYRAEYQIVFMDIMMPMLDGMEAAKLLRQKDSTVVLVFVTTMRQYAVQGYEVDACDFLVKPVTYPEFALKFTRILSKVPSEAASGNEVFLKTENSFVRLSSRDILYVEVSGHYCIYHTVSGDYRRYQTMKSAESSLPADSFARCNNYLLVNLAHVSRMDGMEVHVGGAVLPVSYPRRKAFADAMAKYMERGKQ